MSELNIPIGIDNFSTLVNPDNNYLFVDKSSMIAKVIKDGSMSTLITRPRRWGKTLNFSMLQHFFAAEVAGKPTAGLFKGLEIEQLEQGKYMAEQGKYPVIFLTFKGIKAVDMQQAYADIERLLCELFDEHAYLLAHDKIAANDRLAIERFVAGQPKMTDVKGALAILSRSLYQYTGQPVYIFIDEYDTPVMHAYECDILGKTKDYLHDLVGFMKRFLTAGLKGNNFLKKGIVTGILRVSYHEMLSDLNNLDIRGILNDTYYNTCYGFTETEVESYFKHSKQFISQAELTHALDIAKHYYNGYKVRDAVLYNPWSIISYLKYGEARPYWVNTGNDSLIRRHALHGGVDVQRKFSDLIQGKPITESITPYVRFNELQAGQNGLWTVLLYAGYLIATSQEPFDTNTICDLVIPNQEVRSVYSQVFSQWFASTYSGDYHGFMRKLANADIGGFMQQLNHYLNQSGSVRDFHQEGHYHTFILGLACGLMHSHIVCSNGESGWGYADMIIIPKNTESSSAIIFEFKQVKTKAVAFTQRLTATELAAQQGLAQITTKRYATILHQHSHITDAVCVGMAFCGKIAGAAYRYIDLQTGQFGAVQTYFPSENFDNEE